MPEHSPPSHLAFGRIPAVLGAIVVGSVIGFAGIYGLAGLKRNALADAPCSSALELSKKLAPLAKGEVAALTMATKSLQMPDLAFVDGDGQPKKLSDWKGRTVLLTLWATCGAHGRTEIHRVAQSN